MHTMPVVKELFASWRYTLEHWTQGSSHDTLLGLAAKHQQLAWLAARYRDAARGNPRDWIARDRLKNVQRAAALLAFTTPATREIGSKTPRAAAILLLAAVLFAGLGLRVTDFMRQQQQQAPMVSRHP